MALQGKVTLDGADYAPFNLYGVGVFIAFSGNGIYRNNGACGAVKSNGPLPLGKYWIVERGSGGFFLKQRQKSTIHGINFIMGRPLDAMSGLLCTKMT